MGTIIVKNYYLLCGLNCGLQRTSALTVGWTGVHSMLASHSQLPLTQMRQAILWQLEALSPPISYRLGALVEVITVYNEKTRCGPAQSFLELL